MSITFKQQLIKTLTPILLPFVKIYWFIFKPTTHGIKVVVEHNGKVLLIRNAYGSKKWTFPGGKIEKNETSEQAAAREVKEEINIEVSELSFLGTFTSMEEHKKDHIDVFSAISATSKISPNKLEIKEAVWFEQEKIPTLSTIAQTIWLLYKNKQ